MLGRTSAHVSASWTVVVPFKGGSMAKSRLGHASEGRPGLHPEQRRRLALAFLRDTVVAARAAEEVGRVVVVSADPAVHTMLPGVTVVADPQRGLNAAVEAGLAWARDHHPVPVAALTGDLPCLSPRDLSAALDLARRVSLGLVPDKEGSGSTLITAAPGAGITPRFGPGSSQAHRRAGHAVLPVRADSSLRQDVDTVSDLHRALERGAGLATEFAALQWHADRTPRTRPFHGTRRTA
ncbi:MULTISPECIES: 2-phospho-L-lactate guanylyltransferase [Citricoccus]|uniref:2-phospho-L-lactate guanylyltransferase n=1 Tax=Citricoccus TaxID=169133 RepID=UPI000255EE27|nr:2-phospho-L-lactate guanylyltransferase [Citricoccus sp. CH26A]